MSDLDLSRSYPDLRKPDTDENRFTTDESKSDSVLSRSEPVAIAKN